MEIFLDHCEWTGCIKRFDLFERHGHIAKDLAMEGDCAAKNADELAGELFAIGEGNGVRSLRMHLAATE